MTTTSTSSGPSELEQMDNSVGAIVRNYVTRIRGGDVGALPAILGLVALVIVFSILKPQQFTNAFNFANLINQGAAVIVLAMGLVFVLLLGEIDLSAGYTAGTAASVMGIWMTRHDFNWVFSVLICLATGVVIGTAIGLLVARLQIPSFVVTLAFFLALQGLMLVLIGNGGTIPYRNDKILAVMNEQLPIWLGWTLSITGLAIYALVTLRNTTARRKKGLQADPFILWAAKVGAISAILIAATAYLSRERAINPALTSLKGIPIVVVVLVALLLVLTFLLSRTAWGRHVYAVGGNAEAARRAGINVAMVRLSCFIMCSTLASIAGILLASRTNSVSPSTGGQQTLLFAVGAAVIGGTSLFGGKGKVIGALIGGAVVAIIDNGMALLNQPPGRVFMVTGGVLLLAASVDAISRRRAAATGRL